MTQGTGTGELDWYCLRVISQREDMVAKFLRYYGLKTEIKTERRFGKWNPKKKERVDRFYCVASGYVFIGLPTGDTDPWRYVRKSHLIRSVVSREGQPARLDVGKLIRFLGYDDFDLPSYFQFFRAEEVPEFAIGDRVRVTSGALAGFDLPVQDIRAGEAIFHLLMFDKTVEVPVRVNDCIRAEAA